MSNIQKTLFEENYLVRSIGALATRPDIALTELVANAWDAGASKVDITIPKKENELLIVEDNGSGMTNEQFHARWMRPAPTHAADTRAGEPAFSVGRLIFLPHMRPSCFMKPTTS
jgi:hypothetical protein